MGQALCCVSRHRKILHYYYSLGCVQKAMLPSFVVHFFTHLFIHSFVQLTNMDRLRPCAGEKKISLLPSRSLKLLFKSLLLKKKKMHFIYICPFCAMRHKSHIIQNTSKNCDMNMCLLVLNISLLENNSLSAHYHSAF